MCYYLVYVGTFVFATVNGPLDLIEDVGCDSKAEASKGSGGIAAVTPRSESLHNVSHACANKSAILDI